MFYSYLSHDNDTEIVGDKVVILNGIYTSKKLLTFINDLIDEYGISFTQQENGKILMVWNSFFELWVYQTNSY